MPVGQSTLNFGAIGSPSVETTVTVTGQGSIIADSKVEAWARLAATPEHSVDEVRVEALKVAAGNIVAGTGFTIYGQVLNGRTYGTYLIDWVWI